MRLLVCNKFCSCRQERQPRQFRVDFVTSELPPVKERQPFNLVPSKLILSPRQGETTFQPSPFKVDFVTLELPPVKERQSRPFKVDVTSELPPVKEREPCPCKVDVTSELPLVKEREPCPCKVDVTSELPPVKERHDLSALSVRS